MKISNKLLNFNLDLFNCFFVIFMLFKNFSKAYFSRKVTTICLTINEPRLKSVFKALSVDEYRQKTSM